MYEIPLGDGSVLEAPDYVQDWPQAKQDEFVAQALAAEARGEDVLDFDASREIALKDVPAEALANLGPSAKQFMLDMTEFFRNPAQTAKNLGKIVIGSVQKVIPGQQGYEGQAEAVGEFFADRYGGWDELKRTVATDPVGFLADASTFLTGGGAAAARAPGMAGRMGSIAAAAGKAVDPLALAAKGAGKTASAVIGRMGTHTGPESLEVAAKAGFDDPGMGLQAQPGRAGAREAFRESISGVEPMRNVVDEAREAVVSLKQKRAKAYEDKLAQMQRSTELVQMADINKAITMAVAKHSRGSRRPQKLDKVIDQVQQVVESYNDAPAHAPYVLDILKQDLWDIQSKYMGKRDSRWSFVDTVRRNVKQRIADKAPIYNGMMRDYSKASELIKEIEGTLSLNPNARVDTSLRKLQSVMRNNANTSYGYRAELVDLLRENGAEFLFEKLAGQSLSPIAPRGLGAVTGGGVAAGSFVNPALAVTLPFMSPRIMGEAAHTMGRGAGIARRLYQSAPGISQMAPQSGAAGFFQAGRASDLVPAGGFAGDPGLGTVPTQAQPEEEERQNGIGY